MIKRLNEYPEILELYEKAELSSGMLGCESVCMNYVEGFKFGFLMALDVMGIDSNDDEGNNEII